MIFLVFNNRLSPDLQNFSISTEAEGFVFEINDPVGWLILLKIVISYKRASTVLTFNSEKDFF